MVFLPVFLRHMAAVQDPAVLHQIPVGKRMAGLFEGCRKLPQAVHRSANTAKVPHMLIVFHNILDPFNVFLLQQQQLFLGIRF